jgi:hypothetical protein
MTSLGNPKQLISGLGASDIPEKNCFGLLGDLLEVEAALEKLLRHAVDQPPQRAHIIIDEPLHMQL